MRSRPLAARSILSLATAALVAGCADDQRTTGTGPDSPADVPTTPSLAITANSVNNAPELPRTFLSTDYVAPTGKTFKPTTSSGLQSAINSAVGGDVIILEAGRTYTANYFLPAKSSSGWITIRTSTSDSYLPQGRRVGPSDASKLARIVSPNAMPAIQTKEGAHNYRLVGLEVTATSSLDQNNGLVYFGTGYEDQSSEVPRWIIGDRLYVHAAYSGQRLKRCIQLNSSSSAVIDSYLSGCKSNWQEAQAISGWNGPGPYKIVNNYLEGAAQGILFGGADPRITYTVPSDIEIRRNYFTRPTSWKDVWEVKNILELKNARRVLIEGNVFENNWQDAQVGFAFVWKSVNQSGRCTWCTVSDITFRYNKVRRTAGLFAISSKGGSYSSIPLARIRIENNLMTELDTLVFTGSDRAFQFIGSPADITVNHNTIAHYGQYLVMLNAGSSLKRFDFRNNVVQAGSYGVKGDNTLDGTASLNKYAYGWVFPRNVVVRYTGSNYPTDSYYPSKFGSVGFVNYTGGNYRLSSGSAYKGKSSDGIDPGADIDKLEELTAGVVK